jgi:hypothetical protein
VRVHRVHDRLGWIEDGGDLMADHTPTPWVVVSRSEFHNGLTYMHQANAAFIVKAVNSHDALVKALQQIANGEFDYLKDAMNAAGDALEAIASIKERA